MGFVRIDGLVLLSDGKPDTVIMAPQGAERATYRGDMGVFLIATKGGELWCRFNGSDIDDRWGEVTEEFREESLSPGSLTSPFRFGVYIDPYDLLRRQRDPDWIGRHAAGSELGFV
jgi:hypothetical protein